MEARNNTVSEQDWRKLQKAADKGIEKITPEEFDRRTQHVWDMQKNRKNN